MKLAIVSHTEHYKDPNGQLVGWGPTVREVNYLAGHFEKVYHLAMLHEGSAPASALPYEGDNIEFIALPAVGGPSLQDKLRILTQAPKTIGEVDRIMKQVDAIQFRVPTGIGTYLLPWLWLKTHRPFTWVKYAGNWNQEDPPKGYAFQRWFLKRNFLKCPVTINGKWPEQPKHCITFENPCLDEPERKDGWALIQRKDYSGPLEACFVGRLETAKGVRRILNAASIWKEKGVTRIHLIGDGAERAEFEKMAGKQEAVEFIFHGGLPRDEVASIMKESHLLLLPSTASEGFPKVIAEGANYGALPVVSDVSSIGQYIHDENGWLWPRNRDFNEWLSSIEFTGGKDKARMAYELAENFTFGHYTDRILNEILK